MGKTTEGSIFAWIKLVTPDANSYYILSHRTCAVPVLLMNVPDETVKMINFIKSHSSIYLFSVICDKMESLH